MKISYKWLGEYLPEQLPVEELSKILTSIGLEVENVELYESYKGGLKGLIIGEVITCVQHPNADKLKITTVNVGTGEPLTIVCGAPNVATGQKVIVATVGTTIYPLNGEPFTIKSAKIRGEKSEGMICAEDEIGVGHSHDGIIVLPDNMIPGTPATEYYANYTDHIYEIGLTPNRMDAMSHWGVAKDVCAYLSHHTGKTIRPILPETAGLPVPSAKNPLEVIVENPSGAKRYSGICINNVSIQPSPEWMQQKLKAIGLRPINNIVDITNFIQHETGLPLHAFDADKISGQKVIVKNLPEGTLFITLDGKQRKLSIEDLMICDAEGGMCIAGVFGGLESGVTEETKNIFIECACFDPVSIRKTSFRHGLRTDAATRFEKGVDISATVNVLKRSAQLITTWGGGVIASGIYDIYPEEKPKTTIVLQYDYLKKISGKEYAPAVIKEILTALAFEIVAEDEQQMTVAVPYAKPDIALPADIVEEIIRIDGLDNIEIPATITFSPAIDENIEKVAVKEKIANYLAGVGFREIISNSITNKAYFGDEQLQNAVIMKNSLTAELNILRPDMLVTGLEIVEHNLNHRNNDIKLFEFGKSYRVNESGGFEETEHLCVYITGNYREGGWRQNPAPGDLFLTKGIINSLALTIGLPPISFHPQQVNNFAEALTISAENTDLGYIGYVDKNYLQRFGIKQAVLFAQINIATFIQLALQQKTTFVPLTKYPSVNRDIAMIVPSDLQYAEVEIVLQKLQLKKLQSVQLFDVFESEKLGKNKKSFAISFTFQDNEKTLTDKEIDQWMKKIMESLERDLQVEIRKQ